MPEPTITSNIEVYPEWFSGRIFPKVQWEDQSIEKIVNRYANGHKEELLNSFKKYHWIERNTIETICKCSIIYICTISNEYDDTIIKNLSLQKLSPKNIEKYGEILELINKVRTIAGKYEQTLRNLTDKELNSIDETTLDELILENESEQGKWFLELIEKINN